MTAAQSLMNYRRPFRKLAVVLLLLVGAGMGSVVAQAPGALTPTPAPAPPVYVAPGYPEVLAGKVPLRLLITTGQRMLAWKGAESVRTINTADGQPLHLAKTGEMVGIVRDADGASCWLRQNGNNFCAAPSTIRLLSVKPLRLWTPTPDTWLTLTPPVLIVPTADGGFSVAREVKLEDYLRDVVPAEMPSTFHPQALRAQAVIARTYALTKLGRHAAEGADLCADVHCQVCGPEYNRTKETDQAIRDTRGLVLLAGDKLVDAYYSSTCGGVTDDAGLLWGPEYSRSYLVGAPDMPRGRVPAEMTVGNILASTDAYCKDSKWSRWTKQFTAAEVNALVVRNLPLVTGDPTVQIRAVTNLAVEERTSNGRVASLRVTGDGASVLVFGDQARWLFGSGAPGPDGLWSALFELTVTRDAAGVIAAYTFRGAGRGHGIGMCQWGADGRARAGQSFRDILRAYYTGARLSDERK